MTHNSGFGDFDWDDLRFALAVADTGSVNAAAKRLGVNHATVLRRIAGLEDRLGAALFQRRATGYTVTPAAQDVIDAMRDVGAAAGRVRRVASGDQVPINGPIHITSTDSLTYVLLPPHVAALTAASPGLEVSMISTNSRLNFEQLDAELAIRPAQTLPADMVGDRVGAIRLRPMASEAYLANRPAGGDRWLCATKLLRRSPAYQFEAQLPQDQIALRADSFMALASFARQGLGVAMLPTFLGEGLSTPPDMDEVFETGLWVAAHADLVETPRIAHCRRRLADALRGDPHVFGEKADGRFS